MTYFGSFHSSSTQVWAMFTCWSPGRPSTVPDRGHLLNIWLREKHLLILNIVIGDVISRVTPFWIIKLRQILNIFCHCTFIICIMWGIYIFLYYYILRYNVGGLSSPCYFFFIMKLLRPPPPSPLRLITRGGRGRVTYGNPGVHISFCNMFMYRNRIIILYMILL